MPKKPLPIPTRYGPTLIPHGQGYRVNFRRRGVKYRRTFRTAESGLEFLEAIYQREKLLAPLRDSDVRDAVRLYLNWSERDAGKGISWVKSLAQMLGMFADHLESIDIKTLGQIDHNAMRSFRTYWLEGNKHRSENTWEKYRQGISSFLNWQSRRTPGLINVASDSEFKRKVHQNPPDTLEPDEIEAVLKYFDAGTDPKFIGTAIRILLFTGIRLGELAALKWSDVKLTKDAVIRCGTKTKKTRTVPIAAKLLPHLKALPRGRRAVYVFDNGYGQPLYHRKRYYQEFQKALATMGLRRRPIHALRHTFVRYLLEAGTPINEVARIVGHEDIRTTMRYAAHFSIERARDAVDTLPF